jgi:lysophospholipase L1-like esterase
MKKFLVNSAVMLVALLVGLILVEGMVRLTAEPWLQQRMAELNPDSDTAAFGSDTTWSFETKDGNFLKFRAGSEVAVSHFEYDLTAHIDGMSGRVTVPTPGPEAPVVPLFGDSFVFGIGVADGETIASRLAERHADWRFLNLGVPGTALSEHLYFLRHRHQEIGSPDRYVFFMYTGNDLLDIFRGTPGEAPPEREVAVVAHAQERDSSQRFLSRVNAFVYYNPVLKRSYAIQLVRRYLLNALNASARDEGGATIMHPSVQMLDTRQGAVQEQAAELLAEQFRRLDEMQDRLGFSSLVIIVPNIFQLDAERLAAMTERYAMAPEDVDVMTPNRIMTGTAAAHGFTVFDSTACMADSGDPKALYYLQDDHLRPAGVRALAACIDPVISDFLAAGAG